jgi:glycosyltransferase involved in cell wall biosynthesis
MNTLDDITGIVVTHNTKNLIQRAYESIRRFHPQLKIIIIDGSDPADECYHYVSSLASEFTIVGVCNYNIGHGRGMDAGIKMCKTHFALMFDSDIAMLKSPLEQMLALMESDTYGVGYLEKTGYDGYEYGAHAHHRTQGFMWMLHPYFQLLQVSEYFKYHPYVHHGAPCYLAALEIHNKGLTSKIIKEFPGLGHSSGKGWNWIGAPREYIQHDTAGTRKDRVRRGKGEIEGNWVLEENQLSHQIKKLL